MANGVSDSCALVVKKPVSSVTLSSNSETMTQHDKLTLTATVAPTDATYPAVTWPSDNPSVATVDQSGNVEAVGDTLKIEIDEGYLGDDGTFEIVALDDEGIPLGSLIINTAQTDETGMAWWIWLIIVASAAGILVALYFIFIRKRLN